MNNGITMEVEYCPWHVVTCKNTQRCEVPKTVQFSVDDTVESFLLTVIYYEMRIEKDEN